MKHEFPICVRFENGEVEEYEDVDDLIHNLKDFDSDPRHGLRRQRCAWQAGSAEASASRLEGVVFGLTCSISTPKRSRGSIGAFCPRCGLRTLFWVPLSPGGIDISNLNVLEWL